MNKPSVDNMLFSCLTGYNMYVPSKSDPSTLTHLLSETEVTIRPVKSADALAVERRWQHFVERPIDVRHVLWPVDIVQDDNDGMALVFRKRVFPKMEPLKKLLYNTNALSWENANIKAITAQLLSVFSIIHNGGYAYHAFDMEHIFYNERTNDVLIDFSLAMSRHHGEKATVSTVLSDLIAVEFLPPWVPFDKRDQLALIDDYYAIAAMLFRLFIGRMPYQGRLMDGQGDMMDAIRDKDPDEHRRMFEYYHSHPVFLFDPTDTSNAIGLYTNEEKIIDRWEALPASIRSMFITVFSKDNLDAPYENKVLYSADEWTQALQAASVL